MAVELEHALSSSGARAAAGTVGSLGYTVVHVSTRGGGSLVRRAHAIVLVGRADATSSTALTRENAWYCVLCC